MKIIKFIIFNVLTIVSTANEHEIQTEYIVYNTLANYLPNNILQETYSLNRNVIDNIENLFECEFRCDNGSNAFLFYQILYLQEFFTEWFF